jgi:hypothetical protein
MYVISITQLDGYYQGYVHYQEDFIVPDFYGMFFMLKLH